MQPLFDDPDNGRRRNGHALKTSQNGSLMDYNSHSIGTSSTVQGFCIYQYRTPYLNNARPIQNKTTGLYEQNPTRSTGRHITSIIWISKPWAPEWSATNHLGNHPIFQSSHIWITKNHIVGHWHWVIFTYGSHIIPNEDLLQSWQLFNVTHKSKRKQSSKSWQNLKNKKFKWLNIA